MTSFNKVELFPKSPFAHPFSIRKVFYWPLPDFLLNGSRKNPGPLPPLKKPTSEPVQESEPLTLSKT
jgi:hypothetical protein